MNDEPFAFLDDEDDDDTGAAGIAWLPLALGGLALSGFLVIPILGLLQSDRGPSNDWANYEQNDPVSVNLVSSDIEIPGPEEALLTPNPMDHLSDLQSVDETLSNLGLEIATVDIDPEPLEEKEKPAKKKLRGVEVAASATRSPGRKTKKENLTLASRIPRDQRKDNRGGYDMVVKEGDTLYSIARRTKSSPEEIARMNNMSPNDPIKVGQTLKVPGHRPVKTDKPAIKKEPVAMSRPKPINPGNQPATNKGTGPKTVEPFPGNPSLRGSNPYTSNTQVPNVGFPAGGPPNDSVAQPRPATQPPNTGPKIVRPAPQINPNGNGNPNSLFPDPVAGNPNSPAGNGDNPSDNPALPKEVNPLDKYSSAVAYRVQAFDNLNRIADALATTPEELIELNGRSNLKKGEMLVVPVDNCLIKND